MPMKGGSLFCLAVTLEDTGVAVVFQTDGHPVLRAHYFHEVIDVRSRGDFCYPDGLVPRILLFQQVGEVERQVLGCIVAELASVIFL